MTTQSKTTTQQHTAGEFYVARAWTINSRGREVPCGWDLLQATQCDGEPSEPDWCNRFAYKRHAIEAAARCNATIAKAQGAQP